MNEEDQGSSAKDIIEATTGLVKAVPIYQDMVQPAAKELGTALETVAKTVNLALTPISGVIWGYDQIRDYISTRVSEKLKNVPLENIQSPSLIVAGPAIEALRYTGSEEVLREMYSNLLANAIDIGTRGNVHPSSVEIIRQLDPDEAKLLTYLCKKEVYPKVCTTNEKKRVRGGWYSSRSEGITSNQVRHEFEAQCVELKLNINVSSALDNFLRLRILEIETHTNQTIKDSMHGCYSNIDRGPSEKLQLEIEYSELLRFTDFGMKFINTCVLEKI